MSNTKDTGFLRNLISYDASGNITLPANLTVTGSLLANGGGSYATQSYVTTQITNLINSAPTALDTLNELAAALGNDANFSTTVTNSIASKLALSGGTLTGALNGTSASFSSTVLGSSYVQGGYLIGSGSVGLVLLTSADWGASSSVKASSTINGGNFGPYLSFNNPADKGFTFTVNNSSVATISSTGGATFLNNVGIGTGSPSYRLHVVSSNYQVQVEPTTAASMALLKPAAAIDGVNAFTVGVELSSLNTANFRYTYKGYSSTSNYVGIGFWGNDDILNVVGTGRVGIGTSTPTTLLDARLSTTDNVNGSVLNSYPIASFIANASGGGTRGLQIGAPTGGIASPVFLKVFGTSSRFAILNQTNTENLTILENGNIGIGTTTPAYNLSVASYLGVGAQGGGDIVLIGGGSGVGAFIQLRYATGTTNVHLAGNGNSYLNANYGNVGIGTTTPSTRLSLGMGIGAKFMVYDNPSTGVYAGLGQDLAGGNSTDFFAHSYGNYGFLTFGKLGTNASTYTEWMRIDPSGNVGIGNTSPLQSLGRTLTVEGTGVFQTGVGGGNYNENLRLNRTGNGYSAIAMGGAYGSTSGSGVGVWTIAATPSGSNYRLDLDYNGGTRLSFRTDGQIQQGGVGIVQVVPIGPIATNVAYSATINGQYTLGSTSIPSDARWLLVDIFVTADISDHQNFMFTRSSIGSQKTWVNTRGNNPASEFGNLTSQDIAIITYFGESDGFSSNYGIWYSSKLIPSVGRTCYINNYGNSNSNGYIYFIVRGYSL